MTSKQLRISQTLSLPLDIVTQKTSILAKSGAGKSNGAAAIVEEILEAQGEGIDVHVAVVDPKGDWWGLRSSRDGASAGYPVVVFGSQDAVELGHADVLLEPTAGDLVADFVVDEHVSAILDVSDFSGAEQARFTADFCARLMRRKAKEPGPCLVVLEEADELCPQRVEGDKARMVGAVQRIAKRGRFAGLGFLAVTQRSASLNKDILTQSDTLIVMRTTAPQDIAAIDAWVQHHPDQKKREQLLAEVASLQNGEAFLWSPEAVKAFEKFRFRLRRTFDSGATPKVGEKRVEPKVRAPIDLEALRGRMAASIEKAKQDDPRELRAQVQQLKRELAAARAAAPAPEVRVEKVEVPRPVPFIPEGELDWLQSHANELSARVQALRAAYPAVPQQVVLERVPTFVPPVREGDPPLQDRARLRPVEPLAGEAAAKMDPLPQRAQAAGDVEQRVLNALAELEALGVTRADRAQVALLAGYSNPRSGRFVEAMAHVHDAGLIAYPNPGDVELTAAGRAKAQRPARPRSPGEVQQRFISMLGGDGSTCGRVLQLLVRAGRQAVHDRAGIAGRVGYSNPRSGAYVDAMARLHALGLIEYPASGKVRATGVLFLEGA